MPRRGPLKLGDVHGMSRGDGDCQCLYWWIGSHASPSFPEPTASAVPVPTVICLDLGDVESWRVRAGLSRLGAGCRRSQFLRFICVRVVLQLSFLSS